MGDALVFALYFTVLKRAISGPENPHNDVLLEMQKEDVLTCDGIE